MGSISDGQVTASNTEEATVVTVKGAIIPFITYGALFAGALFVVKPPPFFLLIALPTIVFGNLAFIYYGMKGVADAAITGEVGHPVVTMKDIPIGNTASKIR